MTDPRPSRQRVTDGPLLDLHAQLLAAAERRLAQPSTEREREPDAEDTNADTDAGGATDGGGGQAVEIAAPTPMRTNPRRLLTLAAAAVVMIVIGVAVTLATGDDRPASADVHVERDGNHVTVSVANDISVIEVRDALAAHGVRVVVTGHATGPSLRNRFVGIVGPPSARLTGGDGRSSHTATFEAGSEVELEIGIAARPGEPYDVPPDATRPGEPLAGIVVRGRTYGEVRSAMAAATTATISFRAANGQPTATPPDDAVLDGALSMSDHEIVVSVR